MEMEGDGAILPHDIIIDILKRLPAKSLIRFQCVCKLWKSLIKAPSFIDNHLHHSSQKNPFLLFNTADPSESFPPLYMLDCNMEIVTVQNRPLIDPIRFVRFVGSCNGLLCLLVSYKPGCQNSLLLWNPAIREVIQLPKAKTELCSFHASVLGFGFSSVVNDYRIVKIFYPVHIDDQGFEVYDVERVEVYSLSRGSWKELEFGVIQNVSDITNAVHVNGTVFWLGLNNYDNRVVVVSFDTTIEVFTLIPIPISTSLLTSIRLTMYENKLAMLYDHPEIGNFESCLIDLWMMEESPGASGKSWSCVQRYNIGPLPDHWLYPICIWRNEMVYGAWSEPSEIEWVGNLLNTFVCLFNLTTYEVKFPNLIYEEENICVWNYVESLVSVCDHHVE